MPLRRIESFGPYIAGAAALLSIIVLGISTGYTFTHQRHVDHRLCQSTVSNRLAIRDTWNAARELLISGQDTPEERAQTNDFFDAILSTIPEFRCIENKPVPLRPMPR